MLADLPDLHALPADLVVPPLECLPPAPGKRVRQALPAWIATDVYHILNCPTRDFLASADIDAHLTFLDLPYRNHTDAWVLRNPSARRTLREWAARVLSPP